MNARQKLELIVASEDRLVERQLEVEGLRVENRVLALLKAAEDSSLKIQVRSEDGSDLKLESSNLKLSAKPLLEFERAVLEQFNGASRHCRELAGNYFSNTKALSRLVKRGLMKRITRGVYQKPQP